MHFYRNVFTNVPSTKVKDVAAILKAIHAQENREAALEESRFVIGKPKIMKLLLIRSAALMKPSSSKR